MRRGTLQVLLGAAPGVGKTMSMLEYGHQLRDEGRDVVIGLVETHQRAQTAALVEGLEVIPRAHYVHRGVELTDMDLAAVLRRRPEIALVDELAHTNAPGAAHDKRWRDVVDLLDAGIDVVSTVNIQHVESLRDVVEQITGVPQQETIPDHVLRSADQLEVVDITPQALRERLANGRIYPAERIDAALSNYFRLGNLTALRELALLWLADEVEEALQRYRADHGIAARWESRERVVVALTGGPEGPTLVRRGARIAARAGGELVAVHVVAADGLRSGHASGLGQIVDLVDSVGGTFHQLVGDDIAETLVEFARGANASQLVVGASRRGLLASLVTGPGIGQTVVRESGDIDVHIVNHAHAAQRWSLPKVRRGALSRRRQLAGWATAAVGLPVLTFGLFGFRNPDALTTQALAYQLLAVLVALVGGIWPALATALVGGIVLDYLFILPYGTVTIAAPLHLAGLILAVATTVVVATVVDQAARRQRAARRGAAEAEVLASVAGEMIRGQSAGQAIVNRARQAFGLAAVRVRRGSDVVWSDGDATGVPGETLSIDEHAEMELYGPPLGSGERRLLGVIAAQLRGLLERDALAATVAEVAPLAESDRMRTALLSAVSHDLRRPLASATAAVTALQHDDWNPSDRQELTDTAAESLRQLTDLVTNLLDVSRLQAGALAVRLAPTDLDAVLLDVLDEVAADPGQVELDLRPDLPTVVVDQCLLQRAVSNLVLNALRFSPSGVPVRLTTSALGAEVQVRVIDHGPGIRADRRAEVFVAFQRLGDTDNTTGLGLGLAIAKGFVEGIGGMIEAEDTPGGGLTMVVRLPAEVHE